MTVADENLSSYGIAQGGMTKEKVINIVDIDPKENSNIETVQYIELTKDLEYCDFIGRFTKLVMGAVGFIVDDGNLDRILDGMARKGLGRYFAMLDAALETNRVPAVIAGYLCLLDANEFVRILRPKMTPIPIIF